MLARVCTRGRACVAIHVPTRARGVQVCMTDFTSQMRANFDLLVLVLILSCPLPSSPLSFTLLRFPYLEWSESNHILLMQFVKL